MGAAATKQEAFWEACAFGNIAKVTKLLDEGVDVNAISYMHNSSAIHAASQGKPEIVKLLLAANCHVNVQDDRGKTPLHHAAMKGHADVVELLLNSSADVNREDKNGWTALTDAAYFCQPEAVKELLKKHCDVNLRNVNDRAPIHEVCRSQSTDELGLATIVYMLVTAGAEYNRLSISGQEAEFTPLMFASYHGHCEVVRALIDSGCDINTTNSVGWTALHWAADRGHQIIVDMLLNAGANPLLCTSHNQKASERTNNREIWATLVAAEDLDERLEDDNEELIDDTQNMLSVNTNDSDIEPTNCTQCTSDQRDNNQQT